MIAFNEEGGVEGHHDLLVLLVLVFVPVLAVVPLPLLDGLRTHG